MKSHYLRNLGAHIRLRRKALGLSQEDLAHEVGIDRAYLGRIERGEANLSVLKLAGIAAALRLTAADLLALNLSAQSSPGKHRRRSDAAHKRS